MNTQSIERIPTQSDIDGLKEKIQAIRRQKEYEMLKNDLAEITLDAVNTPNEFEGAMQVPDTEKTLQTKRKLKNIMEALLNRFHKMLSPLPITGNLIAIGLALFTLIITNTEIILPHFSKYQHYLGISLLVFAGIQVIKSSSRSLLIPFIAMIFGAIASHTLPNGQTFLTYSAGFYQYVMITGIIGLGISVLNID